MRIPALGARRWHLRFLILPVAAFLIHCSKPETQAPAATSPTPVAAVAPAEANLEQIGRLVLEGRIDEIAALEMPNTELGRQLRSWTFDYVGEIRKAEALRVKHYDEAVAKAQDLFKRDHLDEAVDKTVVAYLLAKDRDGFLNLLWVQEAAGKVAKRAQEYEAAGQWLESLQLYSDLNSLYDVDTRYKADMQRVAHRVRLLSLYTPKALEEMRKTLAAKFEKDKSETAATSPAPTTAPATQEDNPNLTRWQDHVEGITRAMATRALDQARTNWVEPTNYENLLRGGVAALRLFLTTPELEQVTEFSRLKEAQAKAQFAEALDRALAQIHPDATLQRDAVHRIIDEILQANDQTIQLPSTVALMEFTDGALEKLDPFTAVIWPHEKDEFEKSTRGTFGGVGIMIGMDPNGALRVISPLEDTPAFAAGVEAGDVITAINGKTTTGISIDQAVHQIMGKPDTQVSLTVKREGRTTPLTFTLTRALIHSASVKGYKRDAADPAKWLYMIDPETKIGYVRITGFQEETTTELKNALQALQAQGCRGVVLDLRFNPGGLLKAAIEMSRLFLNTDREPAPTIVSTKGNMTARWEAKARGTPFVSPTLPVTVLINQYSASASEIFSGAIKDLHRGLVIGHRSFGKGSVQDVMAIGEDEKAAFKLTKSYYYLPEGESLHRRDGEKKWGVEPDINVEMTPPQIRALLEARRDSDIIAKNAATEPATQPASQPATAKTPKEPLLDTQLETALLMLRLQLSQPHS